MAIICAVGATGGDQQKHHVRVEFQTELTEPAHARRTEGYQFSRMNGSLHLHTGQFQESPLDEGQSRLWEDCGRARETV